VADRCRRFGISRQTGCTLPRRGREKAEASPRQALREMAGRILAQRAGHPG
jgi:hypothetical protein